MKLHGACILTHNITELVEFYKKLFEQEPEVDGGVDYRFYAQQLIIYKLNDEDSPSTKSVALIYAVEDVDHEYRRLVSLGLETISLPSDKPWGVRSFLMNDPDGNTVSFFVNLDLHP
jgi:Predicted enzyme related to lactoylglutathione lyase